MTQSKRITWIAIFLLVIVMGWYWLRAKKRSKDVSDLFANPDLISTVVVYDTEGLIPIDVKNLDRIPSSTLPLNVGRYMISNSCAEDRRFLWVGTFLCVVTLADGRTVQLALSMHDPVYRIVGSNECRRIKGPLLPEYEAALHHIIVEDFLPERQSKLTTRPSP